MDTSIIYGLIGLVHAIGFVLLLAVVKLGLKKTISSSKLMQGYIIVFLIAVLIIGVYGLIYGVGADIENIIFGTIGELIALTIVFYIVDLIILWIGRKIYRKKAQGEITKDEYEQMKKDIES